VVPTQTQRQVQLRLADIYISLQAQYSETTNVVDRQLFEQELAALETEATAAGLVAEEREDRRDLLHLRLEHRLKPEKPAEVLELDQVVARLGHAVILGDPGSGKSTLLRYLALKHAEASRDGRAEAGSDLGRARFPLLVRIAEYAEEGAWRAQSLSEFLSRCFARHDCPKRGLADLLQSELERGNCLVLLNGLDEVVNAEEV
jgi:predicted NACHT family NTPase